jgi:hypothetical protein
MNKHGWSLVTALFIGGCTAIAGLNGDYEVGDVNQGGAGNVTTTGGNGGTTTNMGGTTTNGGNGGVPSTGGMGGMGGNGGGVVVGGAGGAGGGKGGQGGQGGVLGPTFQVPCAGNLCQPGEVCCVEIDNNNNNVQLECNTAGNCPGATDLEVDCDGEEDCMGNDVCCGTFNQGHYVAMTCSAACATTTMCGGPGAPNVQYCPGNDQCSGSNAMMGYFFCN